MAFFPRKYRSYASALSVGCAAASAAPKSEALAPSAVTSLPEIRSSSASKSAGTPENSSFHTVLFSAAFSSFTVIRSSSALPCTVPATTMFAPNFFAIWVVVAFASSLRAASADATCTSFSRKRFADSVRNVPNGRSVAQHLKRYYGHVLSLCQRRKTRCCRCRSHRGAAQRKNHVPRLWNHKRCPCNQHHRRPW